MKAEFLLEIGCEEIPAGLAEGARASLQKLLQEELEARGLLTGEPVETYSTPRRLIAQCAVLAEEEPDRVEEVTGPPRSVAYDSQGRPTRAAESFASKQGVRVKDLKLVETPKGNYLQAVRRQRGRATAEVLVELLPDLIQRISFPRTMYWGSPKSVHFIRPIRWLLALWQGHPLKFELGGVVAGGVTFGHRLLGSKKPMRVRGYADFKRQLAKAGVVIDPAERRAKIVNEADDLLARRGFGRRADNELLDLLVNLVEHPTVLLGEFDRDFLALPAEILVTVMRHHQKYFSVEDEAGRLVPHFLAVIDLDRDATGDIRRNHETVLAARFRDAQFFWQADQKLRLDERLALTEQIIFQSKLGSYGRKVKRMGALAKWLGETASADGRRADIAALGRAASLCKADLTTEMVRELPELQGIVGGLYARAQGEREEVARAIAEHYQSASADDTPPSSFEGALLALADKLDTVTACFAVGLAPSGSGDPYALRRAATGIVRIVVERGVRLSLTEAVKEAADIVRQDGIQAADPETLSAEVVEFLEDRARHFFRETRGFPYDEVNAVFAAGWDDLVDAEARLEALHGIRPSKDFEPLAGAFKRIRNILVQAGDEGHLGDRRLNVDLLEAGPERELYQAFEALKPRVAELRAARRYREALQAVARLRPQVDNFFNKVLVMAPNEGVRENRLALLAQLLEEFSAIADFSEIVTSGKGKEK